jgi:hypothetical protein
MKRLAGLVGAAVILAASVAFAGIAIEDRNGRKMEVVGNRLFLNFASGRLTAPDGKYFLRDGSFLLIARGRINAAASSALTGHPDIATEVGRTTESSVRPVHPMTIRGFNPQPEPPGVGATPAGSGGQAK